MSNSSTEYLDFFDTDNSLEMTLPRGDAVLCTPSSSDIDGSSATTAEPSVLLQQQDEKLNIKGMSNFCVLILLG